VTEADCRRDRTAALLLADRFLMFCAGNMGEVKDATVIRIGTAKGLGEAQLRCGLPTK
jgi:hypothetical protein